MALTLKDVNVGSTFIDNDTTYNGSPIKWVIAAKNIDGEGVVTLVGYNPLADHVFDVAEPDNTDEKIRDGGNADYGKSNILQFLNARGSANNWYQPQHATDAAPDYASEPGFLNGFSEDLYGVMQTVTKNDVDRKVHLLGWNELGRVSKETLNSVTEKIVDIGSTYDEYNFGYNSLIIGGSNTSSYHYYLRNKPFQGAYLDDYSKICTTQWVPTYNQMRFDYSTLSARQKVYIAAPYAIYIPESVPVRYANNIYYAKFNVAPTVTIDSDLGQHKTTFDFSFTVNDEESDIVSVNAYVDNTAGTAFYSNNNVTLNTPITTAIPTATYDALNYGNHKIIIVASDGQKTTTVESSFEKFDIAPSITVDSSFGQKKYAFGFVFRVVDADDTSSNVTVELEGTQLYSDTVALDTDITVNIPANVFEALSIGQHTITITASDGIKTGTATPTFQRIEISAPVITCEDVGNVLNGFTTYYQVYDEDGGTVDVNIKLDGATISSATDVSQQVDIPITISDAQVTSLSYGAHSILITATDSDNYTSTRTINFNKKSTPYVAIVNPTIGDVTAPFDIVVNYNSPDGDEVTVKAVIDGTIEV